MRPTLRPFFLLLLGGWLFVTTPARSAIIADSVADFSGVQGQNNWFYGSYTAPFTAATFQFLPNFSNNTWSNGQTYTSLINTGGHPGGPPTVLPESETWVVRRWVSPIAGSLTITGEIADLDTNGGDGVLILVLLNGIQIYSHNVNNGEISDFSYRIDVNATVGTNIDFVIAPKSEEQFDYTKLTVIITPEPTALALLAAGLCALCSSRPRSIRARRV